ncbi:hypothetical protein ITZ48_001459 [Escherichia coli]|nr:hypothetical protein [Escherichia coli]
MGSNIIELAKLGHERAAELKASCGAVDVRSLAQLISDLATQLEVQHVRSTNMAVQLANAESKCRELAAENAWMKNALEWLYETVSSEILSIPDEKYSSVTNAAQVLSETPATDAFLAEVRASAIDNLVVIKTKQLADMHPDTHAFGATAMSIRSQINELQMFADQLRKGVQS